MPPPANPPAALQLSPVPVQLPEPSGHVWRSGKASHKWHTSQNAQRFAKPRSRVANRCAPYLSASGTQRTHTGAARSWAEPGPWQHCRSCCSVPEPQRFAGASSRAASDPSSLSWSASISLCFWSQPWEGLAVQLTDPEWYFPSYFGNLENVVVMFLAELFKLPFQRLTFRCNDYRKLLVARNSTIYVCLLRREDPLVPCISDSASVTYCDTSACLLGFIFSFPLSFGFASLKTILECHKQIKLADCIFMEGQ